MQSERLATIGQMSAKVSHEVRNPLSSISLNVELLEDELSALPDDASRGGEASGAGDPFAGRRPERGHRGVPSVRALAEAQTRHRSRWGPSSRTSRISFGRSCAHERCSSSWTWSRDCPTVRVDAGQIRQALLNLIRNAAEAMPDGGTIISPRTRARLHRHEPGSGRRLGATRPVANCQIAGCPLPIVEVTVTDTGVGIAPEDLEQSVRAILYDARRVGPVWAWRFRGRSPWSTGGHSPARVAPGTGPPSG